MECDSTIFALESDLLFTRINKWVRESVGEEHALYQKLSLQPDKQKQLLEVYFRFVCSAIISSDLSNQTLGRIDTLRSFLARCSYMVEMLSNNSDPSTTKYIASFRTKLRSLIRLFQMISSTDYVVKLTNEDKVMKLGALTLHLWGESLLSYAETSLRYWNPQCVQCLKLAEDRLMKCLVLSPNRHQSAFLLGNVFLLQARVDANSNTRKVLLDKSYKSFSFAVQLLPLFAEYIYALARVCALLDQEGECQHWLRIWISTRPSNPLPMLDNADFDHFRTTKRWFYEVVNSAAMLVAPKPTYAATVDDKRYNLLQNSLIESGFSMKKLLELINWLPVSSGQSQIRAEGDNEYVRKQKERLQQRLELYQLKPKRDIPGDGNCQMHAISDQLYDTIAKSADIRKMVVDWLQKNRDWQLPNGAILHQFVHDRKWEEYCTAMAKDGCWGDHLTLLAISEMFGAQISIFSSVEGDNFITEIHPTTKKLKKVLLLSHYAEFHYGSLAHIIDTPPSLI